MARRDMLQRIVPIPSDQPMRGERTLDIAINQAGFLRLTTVEPLVAHMGNCPPGLSKVPGSRPQRHCSIESFIFLESERCRCS